ncbi:hypothetical protein BH24ACT26_BH24ACT26_01780 [soil metagenome]
MCGQTFAATLREPEPERPPRDPGVVALASLFWPGAGHALLGLWGQAIARGVTSLWVLAVMLAGALQQGLSAPISVTFGGVSFALWGIACHDAYREATRDGASVLLTPKRFLYLVLGLLVLSIAMVFVTALGARAE